MTSFIPLARILERIERDKQDSNAAFFASLLYGYEFTVKLTVAAMVAAVSDDKDRHRYRLEHRLVRASGLGEWVDSLTDIFTGPAAAYMSKGALPHRTELNQNVNEDDYRGKAVRKLEAAMEILEIQPEESSRKISLLKWYRNVTVLRNKSRGHGATSQTKIDAACIDLHESLLQVVENFPLFEESWAYIRRNLSGKYRVCPLTQDDSRFSHLRSERDLNYAEGIYLGLDSICPVHLVFTDQELSDFYVANGDYKAKCFSCLSYVSGETLKRDGTAYQIPVEQLPGSVTEGTRFLDIVGGSIANIPKKPSDYVARPKLEASISDQLTSTDHHPIVTLDGRGGIGKTSAALTVIHEMIDQENLPYEEIYWFSARDIDLLAEGAKLVRPSTVTIDDFANQYCQLNEVSKEQLAGQTKKEIFGKRLTGGDQKPTLFVFDNFETVESPGEAFSWIDSFIRPPNKAVITTRIRGEFRGDYQIAVQGMEGEECRKLISQTASRLGITSRLDEAFVEKIVDESEGHPYIIKILLGEIARNPRIRTVERVMASREDILEALFERTFNNLSPAGKRVFLTLSGWRSVVPELAVEAVLIRPGNERIDVHSAVQELVSCSLVDEIVDQAGEYFLVVPLAAHVYGQKKLVSAPDRGSISDDLRLLQQFGAAQRHDISDGLEARLQHLFRNLSKLIADGDHTLDEVIPVVEYVARKMPAAWLYLADLCEDQMPNANEYVRDCLRRYLEQDGRDDSRGWKRLSELYADAKMIPEQIAALVNLAQCSKVGIESLSSAVNRVNSVLRNQQDLAFADKHQLVDELAEVFENRKSECDATDLSRLAWLYLYLSDVDKAKATVELGLQHDSFNEHCLSLQQKLKNQS